RTLVAYNAGEAAGYDVAGGRRTGGVRGLGGDVTSMALGPDGRTLAVGGSGSIRLWDLERGRRIGGRFGTGAKHLAFNADGDALVARTPAGVWQVWRLSGGTPARPTTVTGDAINTGDAVTADAALTDVKVGADGLTRVELYQDLSYRLTDRRGVVSVPGGPDPAKGRAAAFSPDGAMLAVGDGPDVRLWDVTRRRWSQARLRGAGALMIGFNRDGRHLATYDGTAVSVWSVDGVRVLTHPLQAVSAEPRFGRDDATLACLLSDGTVVTLDLAGLTRPRSPASRAAAGAFSRHAGYAALRGA
uniref:WD40 repeat domain-containing protein n=1 Tax=Nonomuraea lactucae TaxID=2249762 RepID=UPI0013B39F51